RVRAGCERPASRGVDHAGQRIARGPQRAGAAKELNPFAHDTQARADANAGGASELEQSARGVYAGAIHARKWQGLRYAASRDDDPVGYEREKRLPPAGPPPMTTTWACATVPRSGAPVSSGSRPRPASRRAISSATRPRSCEPTSKWW